MIVMDDGFQNPSLHKDFSLIVVDGARGFGNGSPIPAGPLRASLNAQLPRTNAVLIVGAIAPAMRSTMTQLKARGIPVLTGSLQPDAPAIDDLRGRKLMAFAGIGQPDKFFATLNAAGLTVRATRVFADHHPFTKAQASALLDDAAREHLTLVTTEKDIARMRGDPALAQLADRTAVIPVTMTFDDDAALRREVIDRLMSGKNGATSPGPGGAA
jgi:tetraacyldisaccharide 4'-kinase